MPFPELDDVVVQVMQYCPFYFIGNLTYKPGPAGAQRRRRAKKQIGGRMGHGFHIENSSGMVNLGSGNGESLHIRRGQS